MKYLMFIFLIAMVPVHAQDQTAQYRACKEKASTQAELNICASEEAARTDNELNMIYGKLLLQAANQDGAVVKIRFAERAWVTYRDAYIDAMYPADDKHAEYGSMYSMEVDLLRSKITQRQILALRELLQQFGA